MSSPWLGPAVGQLPRVRVGDLRMGAQAPLVAQARDVAGEPVAVVAVGDRCAHRGVRGAWAQRTVFGDVDPVLEAVALERDGEPLPGLGELGAGGGVLAEQLAHVRGRVDRRPRGLAIDLGLPALVVLGVGGKPVGDGVGVALKPLVGVAAGRGKPGELKLDALDVGVAAVGLRAQLCRGAQQRLAFGALAPPERSRLVVKRQGALGLLAGQPAVLRELLLKAPRPGRRPRVERAQRFVAGRELGGETLGGLSALRWRCGRLGAGARDGRAVTPRRRWARSTTAAARRRSRAAKGSPGAAPSGSGPVIWWSRR
jgi:hypothetical protein